jgi:hypothetical protein
MASTNPWRSAQHIATGRILKVAAYGCNLRGSGRPMALHAIANRPTRSHVAFLLFVLTAGAGAASAQALPPITITPSAPVKITLGRGLDAVWDATGSAYILELDTLTVMTWTTPPATWPPVGIWCQGSTQRAEDGAYEYGCHSSAGVMVPFRIPIQLTTAPVIPPVAPPAPVSGFDPTDPMNYWLKDDFPQTRTDLAPFGEVGWYAVGSLGNVGAVIGHPGVKSMGTTAIAGNVGYLRLDYSSAQNFGSMADFQTWQTTNIVLLDNASGIAPIAGMGYSFGLSSGGGSCGGNSWCIVADTQPMTCATGTWIPGNWMYTMTRAGITNCLDSGVPAASGTWYKLGIAAAAGVVTYTINGAAAQNIAGGPATGMSPVLAVATRGGVKSVWQDFWSFKGTGLTR